MGFNLHFKLSVSDDGGDDGDEDEVDDDDDATITTSLVPSLDDGLR